MTGCAALPSPKYLFAISQHNQAELAFPFDVIATRRLLAMFI